MNKDILLNKITTTNYTKDALIGWVKALPPSAEKRKPTEYKVGDVLMHPIFQHPYVLLEKQGNKYICGIITSNPDCEDILCSCDSRFFKDSYFTVTLFSTLCVTGSWINTYENEEHLEKVLHDLRIFTS